MPCSSPACSRPGSSLGPARGPRPSGSGLASSGTGPRSSASAPGSSTGSTPSSTPGGSPIPAASSTPARAAAGSGRRPASTSNPSSGRSSTPTLRALKPLIRSLDRRIAREADRDPPVGLLRSIPRIGPYRGLLLAAEILPIGRFPSPGHLVSYAGLAPRTRSSGDKTRHGRIPAGCNRWLRGAFVRAALSHRQQAPSSPVSEHYDRLKERLGWQTARVATARKLCRIVYAMLRTGELWRGDEPEPSTAADGTSSTDNMRPRAPARI